VGVTELCAKRQEKEKKKKKKKKKKPKERKHGETEKNSVDWGR
jgi:hypothetical protein